MGTGTMCFQREYPRRVVVGFKKAFMPVVDKALEIEASPQFGKLHTNASGHGAFIMEFANGVIGNFHTGSGPHPMQAYQLHGEGSANLFTQAIYAEMKYFCDCVIERKRAERGSLELALALTKVYEAGLLSEGRRIRIV